MARLAKILLILVAAFVGVGILVSVALFLFFDPNDFRDEISASVKKETGRDLIIEGDLSLRVFPWIAVEIGRTQLGNAEGFGDEPFLGFEQARLSVRLMPLLFRREIAVGTASLDSLTVNLAINKNGVTNWDDLASAGEEKPDAAVEETESSGGPASLDIANISVTNASVSYVDAQAGSSSSITGLSFKTGRIAAGSPFDIDAEFNFDTKPGETGGQLSISGTFLLSANMSVIDIVDLNISGNLRGVAPQPTDFNFDARAMSIDTAAERITLGEMDMGILGISLAADVEPFSYAGDPQPKASVRVNEFSLKELLQTLGSEPPVTADPNALTRVSFSANAAVGAKAIALSDVQLSLDDTTMTGTLSLPKTESGALKFDLRVDSMVLDHYMAPAVEGEDPAADEGDANIEIPVEMIRALNANGTFRMNQATLSGIVFENLQLGLNGANGKLRMHPISAEMFDGKYEGDIRIDASGEEPSISVNENIVDVQLSSLAKAMYDVENISGTVTGKFVLAGRGADLNAIREDLDGTVAFSLADGEFQGTDVWYQLRKARASLKNETPPEPRLPPRTEFTAVTASGTVTNGVLQNDDLLAQLPFLRLTGNGKINFVESNLDYAMEARVVDNPEFAGAVSEAELKDFTSAVIPLKVSGPLASPSIKPDFDLMLRREVEKHLDKKKDELKDRLMDRLLGGDDKPADGEPVEEGSEDADSEEKEEEQDPEDKIKDALKDIFGG